MPSRSPASRRGRTPFDRTNRKIPAWPNHANRKFVVPGDYERLTTGTWHHVRRSCHHLGSLASPNIFLTNSSFFARSKSPSEPIVSPISTPRDRAGHGLRSIHLNTNSRRSSPVAVFGRFSTRWLFAGPTDPISTRRVSLTHLQPNDFSGRSDRLRAIAWTVATHGIASGLIRSGTTFSAQQHLRRNLQVRIPHVNAPARFDRPRVLPFAGKIGPSRFSCIDRGRRQPRRPVLARFACAGHGFFNVSRRAPSPRTTTACGRSRTRREMCEKTGSTDR